jgi:AcrR family transcriptional regulator
MAGLRERKKLATRLAIREAAMRLFADRGFAGTTVEEIAEAAGVSRATVFAYFPTKEEIVFGDAAAAVDGLAARLAEGGDPTVRAVRAWLTELTGWLEPELLLQLRLGREAPAVAARRLQLDRQIEDVIASALERELGPRRELAARLTAASLIGGLNTVEATAAAQMSEDGRALSGTEIDRLLDVTIAYVEAGLSAVTADDGLSIDA